MTGPPHPPYPPHPPDALALAGRLAESAASFRAGLPPGTPDEHAASAARIAVAAGEFAAALDPGAPPISHHDLRGKLNRVLGAAQILKRKFPADSSGGAALAEIIAMGWEANAALDGPAPPAATVADPCPPVVPAAAPVPQDRGVVLIVDDEDESRRPVRELLRSEGYEVMEAGDARQAMRLAATIPFDLILLDLNLPGTDGLAFLVEMRSGLLKNEVPIVMISGSRDAAKTRACLRARANDFLTKPVELDLLSIKVETHIEMRRERLRLMEKFFPPEIARKLTDNPELVNDARDAEVTVLFSDIRGFSRLSERLGAVQTLKWVRATMGVLSECVAAQRGVVVDFIGDGMMAMWGAPASQPDHATRACAAALEMLARLPELNREWAEILGEPFEYSIGVNSGVAQVGNMGTERRFKYGVLGNVVNVASRVQGATKYLKTRLVVAQSTLDRVGRDEFASRRLAQVRVVNIGEPLQLHELAARGTPGWADKKRRYEEALRLYEARDLSAAAKELSEVLSGQDKVVEGPELALMARTMEALISRDRWSKIVELQGK